jgi:UrcA family protein
MRHPLKSPAAAFVSSACMALSLFASSAGVAATAANSGYEALKQKVSFGDLDLSRSDHVAILYSRIRAAATHVCEPADARSVDTMVHVRHCKEQAIAHAVSDVRSAQLVAFHMATTNQVIGQLF